MYGRSWPFPRSLAPLSRAIQRVLDPVGRLMYRALCGALLSASLLARASATVRRCRAIALLPCPPLPALTRGPRRHRRVVVAPAPRRVLLARCGGHGVVSGCNQA